MRFGVFICSGPLDRILIVWLRHVVLRTESGLRVAPAVWREENASPGALVRVFPSFSSDVMSRMLN